MARSPSRSVRLPRRSPSPRPRPQLRRRVPPGSWPARLRRLASSVAWPPRPLLLLRTCPPWRGSAASGVLACSTALAAASSRSRATLSAASASRSADIALLASTAFAAATSAASLAAFALAGASATILVLSALARSSGLSSLADAAAVPASAVVFSPAMATSEGLICSAPLTEVGAGVMFGAGSLACATCTGCGVIGRHHHAHAHPRHAPQLGGELMGQADAAVRGRIAGQHALVHGHARPGDALHERHRRTAVDVGAVVAVLLDHAEHADRRREARAPARHRALRVEAAAAVGGDALLGDRDDDEMHRLRLEGLVLDLLRLLRPLRPFGACLPHDALGPAVAGVPEALSVRGFDAAAERCRETGTHNAAKTLARTHSRGCRNHFATPMPGCMPASC